MALVATLLLIQGVGILVVHGHVEGMADHLHQFVADGDDHVGHADDMAYSDVDHRDATDSTAPTASAGSAGLALAVALSAAAAVLAVLVTGNRQRWVGAACWRPPRLKLTILAVLRV